MIEIKPGEIWLSYAEHTSVRVRTEKTVVNSVRPIDMTEPALVAIHMTEEGRVFLLEHCINLGHRWAKNKALIIIS